MKEDVIALAARHWYGYGRWSAPYWFVGPEPGMKKKEGDNLADRCRAWYDLGAGTHRELLDCKSHHEGFRQRRLFTRTIAMRQLANGESKRPPMQETWRRLIRLLLAFEGSRTDNDAVGDYQCSSWGSETGQTCVIELSALAANNFLVQRDRKAHRNDRVEPIAKRLEQNEPTFAVLYGVDDRTDFETIAGGEFDPRGYRWRGQTLCALVAHPIVRGRPDSWWIEKGRDMRRRVLGRRDI